MVKFIIAKCIKFHLPGNLFISGRQKGLLPSGGPRVASQPNQKMKKKKQKQFCMNRKIVPGSALYYNIEERDDAALDQAFLELEERMLVLEQKTQELFRKARLISGG